MQRENFHVRKGKTTTETVYLVSSLRPDQANAEQLLALNRGHWAIENKVHYVRDMAFDEDRCRACKGNTPCTLACMRNFCISLLRLHKVENIKKAMRGFAAKASDILKLLRL